MSNLVMDYNTAKIIREMREQAHMFSTWLNPQVSREAVILNKCADDLEELYKPPLSEFDKLMR